MCAKSLRRHGVPPPLENKTRRSGKKETKESDEKQPILFGTRDTIRHRFSSTPSKNNSKVIETPSQTVKGRCRERIAWRSRHGLAGNPKLVDRAKFTVGTFVDF